MPLMYKKQLKKTGRLRKMVIEKGIVRVEVKTETENKLIAYECENYFDRFF